ncbi:MAG: NAD+ synthase [Candidatus Altiarchaeales archaeon]|nr:MAG: NAD+ synthase [Candidatus Altiarchaeales archaeon]
MYDFRVVLAQINPVVGDLEHNTKKIISAIREAEKIKADLICFPELVLTGYPPEDLLLKPQFIEDNLEALQRIIKKTKDITAIVGFVDMDDDIYNAAAIIYNQELKGVYRKIFLPNYGVFDEDRYFQAGKEPSLFVINDAKVGITICEDIWYANGPALLQSLNGAELVVNISASPYHLRKRKLRKRVLSTRASDYRVFIAYVNLVGGQDELVFDGGSMIFNAEGELIAQAKIFEEDLLVADLNLGSVFRKRLHDPRRRKEKLKAKEIEKILVCNNKKTNREKIEARLERDLKLEEEIFRALVLGTRDYAKKNGFEKVVIGLSGGIDSSLVAVIAVEALGKDNVVGVIMPSRFTSPSSLEDAKTLAKNLGIKTITLPITGIFDKYLEELEDVFKGKKWDSTEENIQARIRGNILMALSNKFGWLVLTTGNKSEMSVGYTTLYGDMAGGFAVIKDLFKTMVYRIAKYVNERAEKEIIPKRVFEKSPSAELRANQKDEDDLPPYSILDPILQSYIEEDKSFREIVAKGFDEELVKKVIKMVDKNEYKRRQAPPGIRITPRAFGKDRRLPITNRYVPRD